jgi:hypothetical protein
MLACVLQMANPLAPRRSPYEVRVTTKGKATAFSVRAQKKMLRYGLFHHVTRP